MKNIFISFQGLMITVPKDLADLEGIKHGYQIKSEKEYLEIMLKIITHELHKTKLVVAAKENSN